MGLLAPDGRGLIVAMDHARTFGVIPGLENQVVGQRPRCRNRHAGADAIALRGFITQQHTGSPSLVTDRQRLFFIATASENFQWQLWRVNAKPVGHVSQDESARPPSRRGV